MAHTRSTSATPFCNGPLQNGVAPDGGWGFRVWGYLDKTKKRCSFLGPDRGTLATRWSTRFFLTPHSGVLRDQICTTQGLEVNCVRHVYFW